MKKSLLLFVLFCAVPAVPAIAQTCTGSTCTATSTSEAAFLDALPSPSNTNATVVVNIPSGTGTWTTGFGYTIPAAVTDLTIQGNTSTSCSGTPGSTGYSCSATDNTIIQDNVAGNSSLMLFNVGGSSTKFRVTGLTIQDASSIPSGSSKYNGWIQILSGTSQFVRIDHNHFNSTTYSSNYDQIVGFRTFAPVAGVADHNIFQFVQGQYDFGVSIFGAVGDIYGNGDGTYANATAWGSSTTFYVEQNYLTGGGVINDCGDGGAMVVRYNNMHNATVAIQTHGTKTPAGPARGCRFLEAYHNWGDSSLSTQDAFLGTKGTTALIWGNTLVSGYYRLYHGGGDRESGDETETNTPYGWGYCGKTVNGNGVGSAWDGNTDLGTGYPCLDGIGRGQDAQHLNGSAMPGRLNSTTGTIAWSHQYLEPQYLWMNSIGSATQMLLGDASVNNQDYYYDCANQTVSGCNGSFNGTSGTGYGTLAARPATCTAGAGGTYLTSPTGSYGVGYFATDENSGNGQFYVCDSTDHWKALYPPSGPYPYPHPLISGTPTVATPTFSPSSGIPPQTVTIASTTGGATIRYTSDGSTPTSSHGTVYSSPVSVSVPETLKAIAYEAGYLDSGVSSATYAAATYTLSTATAGAGTGTLVCTPSGSGITAGTPISCAVAATGGSTIASVAGCGGTWTSSPYLVTMPGSNCTATATFNAATPAYAPPPTAIRATVVQ
jgi:hypothetical protein